MNMSSLIKTHIQSLQAGQVLGCDIIDVNNNILLKKKSEITSQHIILLKKTNITYVYITKNDPITLENAKEIAKEVKKQVDHRMGLMKKSESLTTLKKILYKQLLKSKMDETQ